MSQRGSVIKRGNTFTAYWFITDAETGKRRQRSKGGFPTKSAARSHLTDVLKEVKDGTYSEPVDRTLTVADFLTGQWLPALRSSGVGTDKTPRRTSTMDLYEMTVRAWIVPHIGARPLAALTRADVHQLLTTLRERGGKGGKPLGDRGVQAAFNALRKALDYAVEDERIKVNPAAKVGRPAVKRKEMDFWTREEVHGFLTATAGDRFDAAWALAFTLGMRRGEIAGLRWEHVDLDASTLRVVHTRVSLSGKAAASGPKTNTGRRPIPLSAELVALLRATRKRQLEERLAWGEAWTDSGYVFTREDGLPYHPEYLSDRFDRLCSKHKLRRIRLHDARHTAASLMFAANVPVKVVAEILGHTNPAFTMRVYQHLIPGMAADAVATMGRLVLGGGA